MDEVTIKDYTKETPVIHYWSRLVIGAKYILELFNDGHARASIIDENIEDSFLEGASTIEPNRVDSLSKRLFEAMKNLQYNPLGGGQFDDELDITVAYQDKKREYRWYPPTEETPNQLEELVQELDTIHRTIPKKRVQ